MKFYKAHGCGNDYIYFNCLRHRLGKDPEKLAPILCDRHRGIGADGIIMALPSKKAHVRMQMYNVDGSQAEMCGNGLRGFVKLVHDHNWIRRKNPLRVETGAGILETTLFPDSHGKVLCVRIDLGRPITHGPDIPVRINRDTVLDYPVKISGKTFHITCISMGNPHCIIYVKNVRNFDVAMYGPLLEHHSLFPNRTNVEFVEIVSPVEVIQRTWERGCGETLACGTGAAAVCAAGTLKGVTHEKLLIHLLGGDLNLDWSNRNRMFLKGPATEIFQGEIEI